MQAIFDLLRKLEKEIRNGGDIKKQLILLASIRILISDLKNEKSR
tara:strand:- start:277 stop:411 length:135 start_codon:yes stop_codon:yes gene_type:complete